MERIIGIINLNKNDYFCIINNNEVAITFENKDFDFFKNFINKSFILKSNSRNPFYYCIYIGNVIYNGEKSCYYRLKIILPLCNDPSPKIKSIDIASNGFINFFNVETRNLKIL